MTTTNTDVKTYNLEQLLQVHKTKSGVVRFLHSEGLSRSAIAAMMGIRYQHVRNILTQPLKKG